MIELLIDSSVMEVSEESFWLTRMARNWSLDVWDWIACFVGVISLIISVSVFISQRNTERNTSKINVETQVGMLLDYVRHMYANLVVVLAVREKLGGRYDTCYPSEEHFLKLKVDMGALYPDAFFNNGEKYSKIQNLVFLLRNYNTEADVALKHMCDATLDKSVKIRDFNTLIFKSSLISDKIFECIKYISFNNPKKIKASDVERIVKRIHDNILAEGVRRSPLSAEMRAKLDDKSVSEVEREKMREDYVMGNARAFDKVYYEGERSVYATRFFKDSYADFVKLLNYNVNVEMNGKNSDNSDKILIIERR